MTDRQQQGALEFERFLLNEKLGDMTVMLAVGTSKNNSRSGIKTIHGIQMPLKSAYS